MKKLICVVLTVVLVLGMATEALAVNGIAWNSGGSSSGSSYTAPKATATPKPTATPKHAKKPVAKDDDDEDSLMDAYIKLIVELLKEGEYDDAIELIEKMKEAD